ncbi:MAG: nucleoside 2-deoxyribosyltransferase [bacterium]
MKVYLAVPIVNYYNRELTHILGKILEELNLEVSSPWVLEGKDVSTSPRDIFYRDISAVKGSDILLAEVSQPSHGVGMEIMQAYISNKIIIMVAREDSNLSYLLTGIPGVILVRYNSYRDLEEKLKRTLEEVKR